jgi:methionyl-tRNA formyltransferase
MTPWPGAAARFEANDGRWENVYLVRARLAGEEQSRNAPGTIDERLWITAKRGYVEPLEVKPSSGRQMTWRDYVNGRHVRGGDRLIPLSDEDQSA